MEFTVKRSEWARGPIFDANNICGLIPSLLDSQGYKCCLGFFGLACGETPENLLNHYYPYEVPAKYPEWAGLNLSFDDDDGLKARLKSGEELEDVEIISLIALTNDDENLSQEVREDRLKQLFALKDVVINFED